MKILHSHSKFLRLLMIFLSDCLDKNCGNFVVEIQDYITERVRTVVNGHVTERVTATLSNRIIVGKIFKLSR